MVKLIHPTRIFYFILLFPLASTLLCECKQLKQATTPPVIPPLKYTQPTTVDRIQSLTVNYQIKFSGNRSTKQNHPTHLTTPPLSTLHSHPHSHYPPHHYPMLCYNNWEYEVYRNHGNGNHKYGYDSYSNHYKPNHYEPDHSKPNHYEPNHSNPDPTTSNYYSHKHDDHGFEHETPKYEAAGKAHKQREIKYKLIHELRYYDDRASKYGDHRNRSTYPHPLPASTKHDDHNPCTTVLNTLTPCHTQQPEPNMDELRKLKELEHMYKKWGY